jgi:hypothetical protein
MRKSLMFRRRRRTFGSSGYGRSYRKSKRPFRPLVAIAIGIGVLIAAELLVRLAVSIGGLGEEFRTYQGDPAAIAAYRLNFLSEDRQAYDGIANHGQLQATRSPLMGYRLAPSQSSNFWIINEQGFRDDEPLAMEKPGGEIRVVVLGGSAAFGELSVGNQFTVAHRLEELLNGRVALQNAQPDQFQPEVLPFRRDLTEQALTRQPRIPTGTYRVINAAVPQYTSGNELAMLVQNVMAYQPDLVIALHGYADLLLPSDEEAAEVPYLETLMTNSGQHLLRHWSQQIQNFVGQAYLVKGVHYWVIQPRQKPAPLRLITPNQEEDLADQLPGDEAELAQRISRYQQHVREIARLTNNAGIPFVIAIQPEITGRQTLTESEAELLAILGDAYQERIEAGYGALATAASQVKDEFAQSTRALNLRTLYANEPEGEAAFLSPIHITDSARDRLSNRLYQAIIEIQAIEPIPFNQAQQQQQQQQ